MKTLTGTGGFSRRHTIFRPDFILFALITLVFWIVMLYGTGHSISHHSHYDEHTRQALAWKNGRIDLGENISYLEIANYNDKYYVSFPPVPSLIEFPLTLVLGANTPNTFTLLLFTWVGMLFAFFILLKLTKNRLLSFMASFSFYWGSTILYLSLSGAVWHQGQLYGLFFAVTAILILLYAEKPWVLFAGGFSLALAVGCRPFYLLMTPFYLLQGFRRFPKARTLIFIIIGLMPPGLFYAIYNYVRFDSFLQFGHKYIPWSYQLEHGVFSIHYFNHNIYHAFINPPQWDKARGILDFHGAGTGLWFSSPVILLGFGYFIKHAYKSVASLRRKTRGTKAVTSTTIRLLSGKEAGRELASVFDTIRDLFHRNRAMITEGFTALFTIIAIWFPLLLHESNGWYQFGYRFSVDLIPILLFLFGRTFRKVHIAFIPVFQFAIIVNIYGAFWFYVFNL